MRLFNGGGVGVKSYGIALFAMLKRNPINSSTNLTFFLIDVCKVMYGINTILIITLLTPI